MTWREKKALSVEKTEVKFTLYSIPIRTFQNVFLCKIYVSIPSQKSIATKREPLITHHVSVAGRRNQAKVLKKKKIFKNQFIYTL